jgi:transposase
MPWKETCAMDEKMSFIVGRLKGDLTMTELCEQFGISRDTGYELWRRYQAQGPTGLKPLSRAPHRPGQAMACGSGARRRSSGRRRRRWETCCGARG